MVSVIFYLPIKAGPVKPEKVEKEEPDTEVSILSLNPFSFSTLMFLFCLYFQNPAVVRLSFNFSKGQLISKANIVLNSSEKTNEEILSQLVGQIFPNIVFVFWSN